MWLFWGWTIFFIVYCFNRIPDRNFFNWIQSFFRVLSFIAEPQYDVLNIQFYKTHPSNAVTIIVSIDTNFRFQILVWLICFTFARRGFQAAALASCSCSSCYCSNFCSLTSVSWCHQLLMIPYQNPGKWCSYPLGYFFEHKNITGIELINETLTWSSSALSGFCEVCVLARRESWIEFPTEIRLRSD